MKISINPVPKPRQSQYDRWQKRPVVMRYRAFADELRLKVGSYTPGQHVIVVFTMPMSKSWSDKKKELMNGKPHKQRPDIDNLSKAFLDALCEDDSHVYWLEAVKLWGYEGEIDIVNYSS